MGTGKSHWGSIWAARHRYRFLDLDEMIEQDEGRSVLQIFEQQGEDYFRQKEAISLRNTEQLQPVIVSCGGGTPCFFDNINWMNSHGTTILLQSDPSIIMRNILSEQDKRPLVKNLNEAELLFFIEQKIKERAVHYQQAKICLSTDGLTEKSIDNFIIPIH
jgi:shikimate kinase